MRKFRNILLVLAPLTLLAACSSNDDDGILGGVTDSVEGVTDGVTDAVEGVTDGVMEAVDGGTPALAETMGTYQITFRNTSATQPMTPPVVAIHDPAASLLAEGEAASSEVAAIAETGDNMPMVQLITGLAEAENSAISDFGVAAPDPAGPIFPGGESTISLTSNADGQVISIISMVICTNDGISALINGDLVDGTQTLPIFDAGSEVTDLRNNYFPNGPCGGDMGVNEHTAENGVITAHPGQSGAPDPRWDFEAGSQLLEVTITRN